MYCHHNLHFSAWSLYIGRAVRLVHLLDSTQSLVIHHYILICASLNTIVEVMVRVYKDIWATVVGEELPC